MSFLVEDEERPRAKLAKASVAAKVKWNQMRVSPSVFNRQEDIDRLLAELETLSDEQAIRLLTDENESSMVSDV